MTDDPYRPTPPEPDAELARLAAAGHERLEQARASAETSMSEAESANIRIAIGSRGWSPAKRALAAVSALGAVMAFVPSVVAGVPAALSVQILGVMLFIGGLTLASIVRGGASDAQVEVERAWAASLPFSLREYFDVLGVDPERQTSLVAAIHWDDPQTVPAVEMLQNLVALHDTRASVAMQSSTTILVRSGHIDTQTNVRVNNTRWLYDNTKFVPYIHGLVDRVLLPLHRAHPMARVSLTRE
jgi:hypothetical protein